MKRLPILLVVLALVVFAIPFRHTLRRPAVAAIQTIRGKKTVAQRTLYRAMNLIEERTGDDPLKIFKQAVENAKPFINLLAT